ncbi:MAG: PAAR domain-containing protein [Proteobacteria bacterium]|nr:PAAR domain-containing protein [Pseudomonadota bacterium]
MGKPAARIGDMTAHGGIIVLGCPTVIIGGMPAARLGDLHVCPQVTPGVPPIPHIGGPISLGSTGVMIGGQPAARMGDMAVCIGPPDSIASGCPTVLIGEMGGGGGGGGGGGVASAIAGAYSALSGEPGPETEGTHWIEGRVVDSAGMPITEIDYELEDPDGNLSKGTLTQDGVIKRGGFESGNDYTVKLFAVYNAKWSKDSAKIGDTVSLSADVDGFDDGTDAIIEIWEQDIGSADDLMEKIETTVDGGKVKTDWEYKYTEDDDDIVAEDKERGYSAPEYYFLVKVEDQIARSGLLEFKHFIEFKLQDKEGKPIPDREYRLILPNGELRKGKLNKNGEAREEDIPPGKCDISFVNPL